MQKRINSFFIGESKKSRLSDSLDSSQQTESYVPLAEKMRPKSFTELALSTPSLRALCEIARHNLPSVILWGSPGVGKTSLAHILCRIAEAKVITLSGVSATVGDIREAANTAQAMRPRRTVLFIDEIHRFSKAQQDQLLPHVESGLLTLIGATSENPYFSVNRALLSRARVYELKPISDSGMTEILDRATNLLGCELGTESRQLILQASGGDAREALNILEAAFAISKSSISPDLLKEQESCLSIDVSCESIRTVMCSKGTGLDKARQVDAISALQKSIRGSEKDAALFYLAFMLENGEDPMYVARRIVRIASEDVGLANPMALVLAVAAQQATATTGMPECNTPLAEAVCYLCDCPKSNAIETAYMNAKRAVELIGNRLTIPANISARKLGYVYTNQSEIKPSNAMKGVQMYLPQELKDFCIFPKEFKYL